MQNAQMHQVLMQNLMLQALPAALPPSRGPPAAPPHPIPQVGSPGAGLEVKEAARIKTRGPGWLFFCKSMHRCDSEKHRSDS